MLQEKDGIMKKLIFLDDGESGRFYIEDCEIDIGDAFEELYD
jgi:hypothetical protein